MMIDQTALDALTQIYKNGVKQWERDEWFLIDCAYYEGRIKKACEVLDVPITFSYLENIPDDIKIGYSYGYNSWG